MVMGVVLVKLILVLAVGLLLVVSSLKLKWNPKALKLTAIHFFLLVAIIYYKHDSCDVNACGSFGACDGRKGGGGFVIVVVMLIAF